MPTIFADSKPKPVKRRIHSEQRIAKKERQQVIAELLAEYDKNQTNKEREAVSADSGSINNTDKQRNVNNENSKASGDGNIEHTDLAGLGSNDKDITPSVYIDTAEEFSFGNTEKETIFNVSKSWDASILQTTHIDNATGPYFMDFEPTANIYNNEDFHMDLTGHVNIGPVRNPTTLPNCAGIARSSDQLNLADKFNFSSSDGILCIKSTDDRVVVGATNDANTIPSETSVTRPSGILTPENLSVAPSATLTSSKQNTSKRNAKKGKKRKEDTEPKFKDIGIQVSIETCDKSVECDIPLDHTNSASCANCFARENPGLAMSDHKYSCRTDNHGRKVSKSNKPRRKGSALAAIIQRLSHVDQRDSETPLEGPALEIEMITDDLCEISTEKVTSVVDKQPPMAFKEPSVDNKESSVNNKELPMEDKELPMEDKEQSFGDSTAVSNDPGKLPGVCYRGEIVNYGTGSYSGKPFSDFRIPISDSDASRNLSQIWTETQPYKILTDQSKTPVNDSNEPQKRLETINDLASRQGTLSEEVLCDAEIPMDDCVIQIREEMDVSKPLGSDQEVSMNESINCSDKAVNPKDELISFSETSITPGNCGQKSLTAMNNDIRRKKSETVKNKTVVVNSNTSAANSGPLPHYSWTLNTHRSNSKPRIWQSESHQTRPWQSETLQNTSAKPKTKRHFSEILTEFKSRLNKIETQVIGLNTSENASVPTNSYSKEQAILQDDFEISINESKHY